MENFFSGIFLLAANNIGGIIGVCILLGFIGVLNQIKKDLIINLMGMLKSSKDHPHESSVQDSIQCDREINMELTKLLVKTQSSRVGLFLFHNGSVFSTNSPIWKISATHEQCEIGITQEFHKVQDVKASLLTPLISPMFSNKTGDGVIRVTPAECPVTGVKCERNTSIYKIKPEAIGNAYTQSFLTNRGTKFAIMAPLLDFNDSIVGFIFLEYCHDGFLTESVMFDNAHIACKSSSIIYKVISDSDPATIVDLTLNGKI